MKDFEKLSRMPEEKREQYHKAFSNFLDNYLDTIPSKLLEPSDENYDRYKCRGNYFTKVCLKLQLMVREGYYISAFLRNWIREFADYYQVSRKMLISLGKIDSRFKQHDIDNVNRILRFAIQELESQKG